MTIAIVLASLGVIGVGHWLLVDDPLEPATAVVVFGGGVPFRAMEAADIFRKGLAIEVWLTQSALHAEDNEMIKLGIHVIREHEYSRQVLDRLGVPPAFIRVIDGRVDNTAQEVSVVAREMRRVGGKRVILITSKYHTRRVRVIWSKLTGDSPQAIVRYISYDPYDPNRWWRNSSDGLAVTREVFWFIECLGRISVEATGLI
jgi:uncharacterized SAM-binding protein YcdF (DUF218 family)